MINCKVESKLKLKKHCVLAAADVENFDTNSKNIDFTIKDTKPYVLKSNFLGIYRLLVLVYSNQDKNSKNYKA